MLFRRRSSLAAPSREALARLLAAPTFELVPLKNALSQADHLPPGATVSVTASPAKGLEATVALCEQLVAAAEAKASNAEAKASSAAAKASSAE